MEQITGGNPASSAAILAQIEAYEDQYRPWILRGKAILERYRDVRLGTAQQPLNPLVQRKFNILWANVETLKPTLYARLPKIVVEREYNDKDPVARVACEIAQRAGNYTIRKEGLDLVLRQCVHDRLLPGRAVAWVDYVVEGEYEESAEDDGSSLADEASERPARFIKRSEKVVPRYCDWLDFGHSPVRVWDEVTYAWYKVYLTEDQCKKRFPWMYGDGKTGIPLDRKPEENKTKVDTIIPQATIYVVYCKDDRMIRWVHKELPQILDEQKPSTNIEGFWPWPRPLFATMTNESLQPVPDFYYYQDQADELDKVTNRLSRVMDAMKVVGVYDKNEGALQKLFHPNGAPDNLLTPVDNWAAFAEKGGFNGAFQMAPLDQLAATAVSLTQQRETILQVIYQITGIADIIRGSSDPNETATAQGIKSQFASLRIKDTQHEVARFSRDIAAMIVEVIVENYEPKTIWEMTNAESFCPRTPEDDQMAMMAQQMGLPAPYPQSFNDAMAMLRNQKLRDFRIEIETDSTIALDDEAEKLAANEFVRAMAEFIQAWGPIIAQAPELLPMVAEMLLFLARRYRAGRGLESAIEQAMDALKAKAQNQPQQPSPEMVKAQAQAQLEQQKAQTQARLKQQEAALDAQLEQQRADRQDRREEIQARADMAVEREKAALDMQITREKAALDAELAREQAALDARLKMMGSAQPLQ